MTALMCAIFGQQTKVVTYLVDQDADVNHVSKFGLTPLSFAAEWCRAEAIRILVRGKANIEHKNNTGMTPLMIAARGKLGDPAATVQALLESGANIEAADFMGWTAIMHAAAWGNTEVVDVLLKSGADKRKEGSGFTASSIAKALGHNEIAEILVS